MTPSRAALIALALLPALAACGRNSGDAQRNTGKVESAVGGVTGSSSLKQQGQEDQVVGGVKSAGSDLGQAIKDATK